jgi:hypothetical protein
MNSDLSDGAGPGDPGNTVDPGNTGDPGNTVYPGNTGDPGIDQLFRILTAGPSPAELAGEQSALAMFRTNVSPLSGPAPVKATPVNGTPVNGTTVPFPAGRQATSPNRSARRPFRAPARWGVRLAAAGAIVIGGMTAAAYAAALPEPVQNVAHHVLGFAGVPEPQHLRHSHTSRGRGHHVVAPAGQPSTPLGGKPHPSQASKPSTSAHASASPTVSPSASPAAAGPATLSASAGSAVIDAGLQPVIDGQLTRAGTGVAGVTVKLIERLAGHPFWHVAGTGQTTSGGNVAITGRPLVTNAVFRLRIPGGVHSASVLVTVTPQITVGLTPGASGLRDMLTVSTQYARRGNVVWLQVQSASGSWIKLRSKRLNTAGKTWFILSGKRLKNKTVRVTLVATVKHGSAGSNTVTVPPPGSSASPS